MHHVRSNQLKITFAEPWAYFAVVACHHWEHDSVADDHNKVAKRKEGQCANKEALFAPKLSSTLRWEECVQLMQEDEVDDEELGTEKWVEH